MKLDSFRLKDVRCFAEPQAVRIRPLTFLVGENSTGKSTVLGCIHAVLDHMFGMGQQTDLNHHPYEMGSFREIVRRSRPPIQSFELGLVWCREDGTEAARYTLELHEREGGARAAVKQAVWCLPDGELRLRPTGDIGHHHESSIDAKVSTDGSLVVLDIPEPWFHGFRPHSLMWSSLRDSDWDDAGQEKDAFLSAVERLAKQLQALMSTVSPARSIAPVRSKPKRTYSPFVDAPDPEGSDVPAALASLARRGGSMWERLKARLEGFGRDSGLFSELAVRKLGRSGSDPFQLQVKVRGSKSNIKDVGYGVSQILPILVRLGHPTDKKAAFLVQQPEVHLHPRGQAALSSILIGFLGSSRKRRPGRPSHFVIETHSDYMIDRARIAIRRNEIASDDVSLVYLEPKSRGGVTVHNIGFDEMGNMTGAPASYRDFFLKESDALLGFGE